MPSLLVRTEELARPRKEEEGARREGGGRVLSCVVGIAEVERINARPSFPPSFPPPDVRLLILREVEGAPEGRAGGRPGRKGGV